MLVARARAFVAYTRSYTGRARLRELPGANAPIHVRGAYILHRVTFDNHAHSLCTGNLRFGDSDEFDFVIVFGTIHVKIEGAVRLAGPQ